MFKKTYEKLMDYSIYFSFDRTGYLRHKEAFKPIDNSMLVGKVAIVTGGTSGIGLEVVNFLKNRDSKVYASSRRADPNESTAKHKLTALDMSCFKSIKKFCDEFKEKVDFLILNAGGMPDALVKNEFGIESQYASQVVGHYLMFRLLLEQKKLNDSCRVIWTTSGGMY